MSEAKASGWLQSAVTKINILPLVVECNGRHIFHRRQVAMCFHRLVWYRALSLRYACIQSLGIILTPRLTLCQMNEYRINNQWLQFRLLVNTLLQIQQQSFSCVWINSKFSRKFEFFTTSPPRTQHNITTTTIIIYTITTLRLPASV